MEALSRNEYCRVAEITPSGMPTRTAKTMAQNERINVLGNLAIISLATGLLVVYDFPKSPTAAQCAVEDEGGQGLGDLGVQRDAAGAVDGDVEGEGRGLGGGHVAPDGSVAWLLGYSVIRDGWGLGAVGSPGAVRLVPVGRAPPERWRGWGPLTGYEARTSFVISGAPIPAQPESALRASSFVLTNA